MPLASTKKTKKGRKPGKLRRLLHYVLVAAPFLAAPGAWVLLTPPLTAPLTPVSNTRATLINLQTELKAYAREHRELPEGLAGLRAWVRAAGRPFAIFDAWGQRLSYQRLDPRHYLLRSFGSDGLQNTLTSGPDIGIAYWGDPKDLGLTYDIPRRLEPGFYPTALVAGSDSPTGTWQARLFADRATQLRQLVVRHKTRTGLFMVARHDMVEEFHWLPDGQRLVFTATGSNRHRDGLYLWNLKDDSVTNIFDAVPDALPMSPAARSRGLNLSLAGVSADGPSVAAWVAERHDGALNPVEFFRREQLVAFRLPAGNHGRIETMPDALVMGGPDAALPTTRPLQPARHLIGTGQIIQQEWLKLPLSGDIEQALLAWHHYPERYSDSAVFPYALWVLAYLYGDAWALTRERNGPDADVLRTFGTEIARALVNYELAPSYLKGMGIFAYESLMDGRALPYRIAELSPAPRTAP